MKFDKMVGLKKGFTLIELLIVVAVIGVLTSIVVVGFPGAQKSARDAKRREELGQYRIALENFANRSGGVYPPRDLSAVKPRTMCTGTNPPLGSIPCTEDPKDGTSVCSGSSPCQYQYQTTSSGANYQLWARLEKPQDNALPCFVINSNGTSSEMACPS